MNPIPTRLARAVLLGATVLAATACTDREAQRQAQAAAEALAREQAATKLQGEYDAAVTAANWELARVHGAALLAQYPDTEAAKVVEPALAGITAKAEAAREQRRLAALWNYARVAAGTGEQQQQPAAPVAQHLAEEMDHQAADQAIAGQVHQVGVQGQGRDYAVPLVVKEHADGVEAAQAHPILGCKRMPFEPARIQAKKDGQGQQHAQTNLAVFIFGQGPGLGLVQVFQQIGVQLVFGPLRVHHRHIQKKSVAALAGGAVDAALAVRRKPVVEV